MESVCLSDMHRWTSWLPVTLWMKRQCWLPTDTHSGIFVYVWASVSCHPAVTVALGSILYTCMQNRCRSKFAECVSFFLFFFWHFLNSAAILNGSASDHLFDGCLHSVTRLFSSSYSFFIFGSKGHFHPNPWNGDSLARWHLKCVPNNNESGTSAVSFGPQSDSSWGCVLDVPIPNPKTHSSKRRYLF